MPNDESNTNLSHENDADTPKKAPIDQWFDGEISTTSMIGRLLSFIGIYPKK
ncbi:hypothetical protein ACFWNH_28990 [Rhodococcus qingshengii]|uniref:hypothetical protein n=1 Tax=Rhodococcus qingshengii TaxID=334542 RepID=UPI003668016F